MRYIKAILTLAKTYLKIEIIISLIAKIFPTRKNTVIFSSYPDYSDNAWALYKYLKEHRKDLKLYWYATSSKAPAEVDPKEIIPDNRFYREWMLNRAYYIFNTHSYNLPLIRPKKRLYVLISHFPCPVKKNKSYGISKDYTKDDISKNPHNFIICQSEGSLSLSSYFWRCEKKFMLPLGMMRNDLLIKNIGNRDLNPFYNGHSQKLILWMPTFRKSCQPVLSEVNSSTESGLPLLETSIDVVNFNNFLKSQDVQLLIKLHPLQADYDLFKRSFSNITILTNETLEESGKQTYEVIGYTDALLTDYSSVFFDYLIVDRPVGFILNDIEEYRKDRGFVFDDPRDIMAGHHIYDINQLKKFVSDVVAGTDKYLTKRNVIRKKYVGEVSDTTCKRFVEYFNI